MRTKVVFQPNQPVAVTLERHPPEFPVEGQWGEQWMYSLAGDRIMWVEPEVHQQLIAAGACEGETYTITKCKDGHRNVWSVIAGDVAQQAQRAISRAPQPAPAQPAPARPPEAPAPARQAPSSTVASNVMQAALCSAIEASQAAEGYAESIGASYRATEDAITKLAITIYIELTGSGSRKR